MENIITIKRKDNQNANILKILAIFRDKDVVKSLEEISNLMKIYEREDQISIKCSKEILNNIITELKEENINYSV